MTEHFSLTPLSRSPSPRGTMTNTALDCCIYDYHFFSGRDFYHHAFRNYSLQACPQQEI